MKAEMINILFYLGYAVATVLFIALLIVLVYYIFFKLLNFKKVRKVVFKIILQQEIKYLSDSQFEHLERQMQQLRRKIK